MQFGVAHCAYAVSSCCSSSDDALRCGSYFPDDGAVVVLLVLRRCRCTTGSGTSGRVHQQMCLFRDGGNVLSVNLSPGVMQQFLWRPTLQSGKLCMGGMNHSKLSLRLMHWFQRVLLSFSVAELPNTLSAV